MTVLSQSGLPPLPTLRSSSSRTQLSGSRLWPSPQATSILLSAPTTTIFTSITPSRTSLSSESAPLTTPTSWLWIGARTTNTSALTVVLTSSYSTPSLTVNRMPPVDQTPLAPPGPPRPASSSGRLRVSIPRAPMVPISTALLAPMTVSSWQLVMTTVSFASSVTHADRVESPDLTAVTLSTSSVPCSQPTTLVSTLLVDTIRPSCSGSAAEYERCRCLSVRSINTG